MSADEFVINRLRSKPVNYSVQIGHFVSDGEWMMSIGVSDIALMDDETRGRIAGDLRRAAEIIESSPDWLPE